MLVIADTSPFIGLLKIGEVDVLPRLYGFVDLKGAFDKLKATNFRVPGKILDGLLERHLQFMAQRPK